MKTIEYRTEDKSKWGAGPWQDEPDKKQWQDAATGLPCLAVRNGRAGNWCGYVGVPKGHPWHGVGYSQCPKGCEDYCDHRPDSVMEVHGGLTFADKCADTTDHSQHICHLPEPGEPDDVWWFGFDCAHSGDISPGFSSRERLRGWTPLDDHATYRDLPYVEREATDLARQLAAVTP